MNNNIKRRKSITKMVLVTLLAIMLVVASEIVYSKTGIWWPSAVTIAILIAQMFLWLLPYCYKTTAYVCPECNEVFKPTFSEFLFSMHVFSTRKLRCPVCNKKHWCKATFDENSDK